MVAFEAQGVSPAAPCRSPLPEPALLRHRTLPAAALQTSGPGLDVPARFARGPWGLHPIHCCCVPPRHGAHGSDGPWPGPGTGGGTWVLLQRRRGSPRTRCGRCGSRSTARSQRGAEGSVGLCRTSALGLVCISPGSWAGLGFVCVSVCPGTAAAQRPGDSNGSGAGRGELQCLCPAEMPKPSLRSRECCQSTGCCCCCCC